MKNYILGMVVLVCLLGCDVSASPVPWNPRIPYVLNPLVRRDGDTFTGQLIATVAEWEEYRQYLIGFAAENAYGKAPASGTYSQKHTITETKELGDGIICKTVNIKSYGTQWIARLECESVASEVEGSCKGDPLYRSSKQKMGRYGEQFLL